MKIEGRNISASGFWVPHDKHFNVLKEMEFLKVEVSG